MSPNSVRWSDRPEHRPGVRRSDRSPRASPGHQRAEDRHADATSGRRLFQDRSV